MVRSNMWKPESWPDRASVPTCGEMLKCITRDFDSEQRPAQRIRARGPARAPRAQHRMLAADVRRLDGRERTE